MYELLSLLLLIYESIFSCQFAIEGNTIYVDDMLDNSSVYYCFSINIKPEDT